MEVGIQIATSTALASIIVKLIDVWLKRKERKDQVEDKEAAKIEEALDKNGKTLKAVSEGLMMLMYDQFEARANKCLQSGEITLKQLKVLTAMHDSYKALGGDGWCDELMDRLNELPIVG